MTRSQHRGIVTTIILAGGGLFVVGGFNGMLIRTTPAHYYGFAIIGIGILGLLGINIWYGGPLDKRRDPPEQR